MMKKDDLVTIKIQDMSAEGFGIGKADGYTLFVKDAVIGGRRGRQNHEDEKKIMALPG